ncbi:MAG TPA: hypothetical protein VIR31_04300 [Nitrososphaeraceae archaeon]
MQWIVTTSIINNKTYLMTFVAWAIIITDVIFGTFLDVVGKPLNSSFGVVLFIAMTITVFFAGLYILRDYMAVLHKDLEAPSFFNRLYRATPLFLYALLAIFVAMIVEMVFFSQYSTYMMIPLVLISGVIPMLFFGFRTYKFLSWFKSSVKKRDNIMILAFAVSSMLLCISVTISTVLDTKELVVSRPPSIDPDFHSSNSMASRHLSKIELVIHLYGFLYPQVTAIAIAETVAVAYFLRYFKDQIGRAIFWTLIILPPVLFLTGIFGPQLLTTGSQMVYMEPRFLIFRILGTAGWVGADLVIAYAYILVAKTLGRQIASARNKIINYLIIAAVSTILVSPTTNNWITNNSYPPFGAIQRAFLVLASFLFSIGIYSVALSVAQDAELRNLARKYAKEYALLDTLGNAQENAEIIRTLVKLIHKHADAMEKETAVESSMSDDNEVRRYLDLVITETRSVG